MAKVKKVAPAKKRPIGKPKAIATPELLLQHFNDYKKEVRDNPIEVVDYKGKDADRVIMEHRRPLTLEGFEVYCFEKGIIRDLGDYFSNKGGRYINYATICSHIRRVIRQDQIEGGMAGVYNPSITQRLNGLVEKTENKVVVEQPLFGDDE